MSRNAKEEFIEETDGKQVLCATVSYGSDWTEDERRHYSLPVGFTPEQFEHFVNELDFEYDDSYGSQELFGTIWYADGTWSDRGEYDGSEWWEYQSCPPIPDKLNPTKEPK